jgi:Xaa-Pro aminopeptidase
VTSGKGGQRGDVAKGPDADLLLIDVGHSQMKMKLVETMPLFGDPRLLNEPRLRAMMDRDGLELLFICSVVNSKYLSGFFHNGGDHDGAVGARPFAVMYFRDEARAPAMLVPAVDLHLAKDSTWISDVRGYVAAEKHTDLDDNLYDDVFAAAAAVLVDRKAKKVSVGIEGGQLSVALTKRLTDFFDGQRLVDVSREMGLVRMVKTPEEIRRIRRAIECTTKAHESFRAAVKPGVTDRDLYRVAATRMIEEGAEEAKFIFLGMGPTRYAANARFLTGYALKAGDFLRADIGASYLGYGADFVRSYALGEATRRQQDVWQRLVEAELELGYSIRAGETGAEIYARGIRAIGRHLKMFPREFVGHGIGLVLNEEPRMSGDNRVPVEPGTVYCTEFSYYLEDGVRPHVEDMFIITENGVELLTRDCPRDLVIPI